MFATIWKLGLSIFSISDVVISNVVFICRIRRPLEPLFYLVIFIIFSEEELLQTKDEFEKTIEKVTNERNALQEKVKDSVNLSEKQLSELHNTMDEKSQRIADLEQELSDVHKKDAKICELELEIDMLKGIYVVLKSISFLSLVFF